MPQKAQVNTDLPENLNMETIQEKMKQTPASDGAGKKAAPEKTADERQYAPSEKTLERLNALPKDEIKKELGLDIDDLVKNTKRYGVLEGLAYGNFTQRPLPIVMRSGHQKKTKMFATIRLYNVADRDTGEMKWGYELHPVKLVRKMDAAGNPLRNDRGEQVLTWERNKLQSGSIIEVDGKELSAEQVNRLRLTGNLGEPVTSVDFNGKPTMTVYSVDPYNEHELIGVTVDSIAKRLDQENEFKYKDENKVVHTVTLSDRMKGALAMGQSQWGKDEAGNNVCIQYNTASGRLEKAVEYEYALRNEVNRKQEAANKKSVEQGRKQAANKKSVEQGRKQAAAEGKSVGAHL